MSRLSAKQLMRDAAKLVPQLNSSMHKGQGGRVAVLGGSKDYTGAPFFSCYSAMRMGCDLGHVICDPSAGAVIKTYSPDIIVHPICRPDISDSDLRSELDGVLSRMHALVIGPGLGRDEYMQNAARIAIGLARSKGLFLVLDADALWLVSKDPEVIRGARRVVLTPNVVEFGRLCEAAGVNREEGDPTEVAGKLATALGNVTIVEKGQQDVISNGHHTTICEEQGGLKRSGGQGDILSGTVGTMLAWASLHAQANNLSTEEIAHVTLAAALGAATVTRTTSRLVYERMGRALQTSDCLQEVGKAFATHFDSKL